MSSTGSSVTSFVLPGVVVPGIGSVASGVVVPGVGVRGAVVPGLVAPGVVVPGVVVPGVVVPVVRGVTGSVVLLGVVVLVPGLGLSVRVSQPVKKMATHTVAIMLAKNRLMLSPRKVWILETLGSVIALSP